MCQNAGMKDSQGKLSLGGGFVAGIGAGVTEAFMIVTPFEVLKTRLQQQTGTDVSQLKYKGPVHAARTIVAEEGAMALWKGNVPTMFRQGCAAACHVAVVLDACRPSHGARPAGGTRRSSSARMAR